MSKIQETILNYLKIKLGITEFNLDDLTELVERHKNIDSWFKNTIAEHRICPVGRGCKGIGNGR